MDGLILNLAPTGMVPTRAMTPHVPLSVKEIVADAKKCVALGVNMLHLHARDEYGQPTYSREVYGRLIGSIREACPEVVICVSLSGRAFHEFEQRAEPLTLTGDLMPDMGSLTLASMNFGQTASINEPEMIQRLAGKMAEVGIKPELEVFDAGMMNYAHFLLNRGLIKPPHYFNFILGNVATAQARPAHLGLLMGELPPNSFWSGGAVGAAQLAMNAMGILFGHGARLGLEDYLWLDAERTQLATNLEMVQRGTALAATFNKRVATSREVRVALGLLGR
jgi:3-keto-5-aminohexanoate cleavage enzyme